MLGRIPLRHLVYRVHSLPGSMRPLVWDFGQLKPEIEELYTRQIVSRFVSGLIIVWHIASWSVLANKLFAFVSYNVFSAVFLT